MYSLEVCIVFGDSDGWMSSIFYQLLLSKTLKELSLYGFKFLEDITFKKNLTKLVEKSSKPENRMSPGFGNKDRKVFCGDDTVTPIGPLKQKAKDWNEVKHEWSLVMKLIYRMGYKNPFWV